MDEAPQTNKSRVTVCNARGRWGVLLTGEERHKGSEISNYCMITRNKQGHKLHNLFVVSALL